MLKAHDVAAVIEARLGGHGLEPMRLQKILYYVQSWHLAVRGEPLFGGHFEAWPEGPVLPEVLNDRRYELSQTLELDDQVVDLIELVVRTYGFLASDELASLVKTETPWWEARRGLREGTPGPAVISSASMADFVRAHRRLQEFSAADLASPSFYIEGRRNTEPFNARAFIEALGPEFDDPPGENPWPSAFGDYRLYLQEDGTEERGPADSGV
ncbi:hypothetical protein GCM10010435_44820 [Winogradskya consettensis]|uniref:Antitoxin SocA-like Panacea domain-containing protein n=1 Tax=Winogradskya consettensis TaxID=113560 RepID=A0A919T029_9ACTN|nr:type II toxin-antitoxin system antitoxin SocA domain-containing protein [Actinoplanes consettensis]GIM82776.1 hypothetical protein Aco04nite_83210 [Actinoplanes consettensis]